VQTCNALTLAGKFHATNHSSNTVCSFRKAFAVVRTSSDNRKQQLEFDAALIDLHNCR